MRTALRVLILLSMIALIVCWAGCSRNHVLDPQGQGDEPAGSIEAVNTLAEAVPLGKSGANWGNNILWGYYEFLVSEDHTSIEPIPLRANDMHVNIRRFLEDSPCSTCLAFAGLSFTPEGYIDAKMRIMHPFLALENFTGFDVRLIFITDGSFTFPETGLRAAAAELGEAVLVNADGYTNLFNTLDFGPGSGGMPLFEYQQGKLAAPGDFSATLNGFKCYQVENERRYFPAGASETKSLIIDPPAGEFRFGYAINASWQPPNPNPPMNIPDDFSINANCIEPYEMKAYLVEDSIIGNGYAHLRIELNDWQGIDTVGSVYVEAPFFHGGFKDADLIESTATWGKYEMVLSNEKYAPEGEYRVLVIAESSDADPHFGTTKAYTIITVPVTVNPMEPIWPMFRHDPRHTGRSPYLGPRTNNVAWKYWTDDYYALHSSPTIDHTGTVYLGGDDKNYYAIYPDGTLKWKWDVGQSWVDSSSCIDPYGNMYIAIDGNSQSYGTVYKFSQDGVVDWEWEFTGWTESSPIIAADGTIVFGSRDDYVYAMNPDGTLKWKYKTGNDVRSSPAMDPYGMIYIGSHDQKLYAFNSDGDLSWTFASSGPIFSSPCIDLDNRIYFGTMDNKVYCIDRWGNEVWHYDTTGSHISSPGLDEDLGVLYIGSDDHKFYAINLDGTLKWTFPVGGNIRTCPAIDAEGYIYIRDRGPGWKVYCIDPDGNEVWQMNTESEYLYELSASPSISNDGSLYIGCSGWAYCFRDE